MKKTTLAHLETLCERYPALLDARESIHRSLLLLADSVKSGGRLLICGNGGSAADAEHITGELMKGFRLGRRLPEDDLAMLRGIFGDGEEELFSKLQRGIPAIPLTGCISLGTAIINDLDPYLIYAQQVYILGNKDDILLGISTSGDAGNVINALKTGKAFGLITLGLCGKKTCQMDEICDCVIHVPETETYRVQELHVPVYHALCLALEEEMFGEQD